jgi:hypothetical protein
VLVACFDVASGDIEDAPAPNALRTYEVYEKNGAVYIKGDEASIKAGQRDPNVKCSVTSQEKVIVIGGSVTPSLSLLAVVC